MKVDIYIYDGQSNSYIHESTVQMLAGRLLYSKGDKSDLKTWDSIDPSQAPVAIFKIDRVNWCFHMASWVELPGVTESIRVHPNENCIRFYDLDLTKLKSLSSTATIIFGNPSLYNQKKLLLEFLACSLVITYPLSISPEYNEACNDFVSLPLLRPFVKEIGELFSQPQEFFAELKHYAILLAIAENHPLEVQHSYSRTFYRLKNNACKDRLTSYDRSNRSFSGSSRLIADEWINLYLAYHEVGDYHRTHFDKVIVPALKFSATLIGLAIIGASFLAVLLPDSGHKANLLTTAEPEPRASFLVPDTVNREPSSKADLSKPYPKADQEPYIYTTPPYDGFTEEEMEIVLAKQIREIEEEVRNRTRDLRAEENRFFADNRLIKPDPKKIVRINQLNSEDAQHLLYNMHILESTVSSDIPVWGSFEKWDEFKSSPLLIPQMKFILSSLESAKAVGRTSVLIQLLRYEDRLFNEEELSLIYQYFQNCGFNLTNVIEGELLLINF